MFPNECGGGCSCPAPGFPAAETLTDIPDVSYPSESGEGPDCMEEALSDDSLLADGPDGDDEAE